MRNERDWVSPDHSISLSNIDEWKDADGDKIFGIYQQVLERGGTYYVLTSTPSRYRTVIDVFASRTEAEDYYQYIINSFKQSKES